MLPCERIFIIYVYTRIRRVPRVCICLFIKIYYIKYFLFTLVTLAYNRSIYQRFVCEQKCNCKIFLGNIGNTYKFLSVNTKYEY
nr:MAG TPA: hypothetical protein [Caudoviricetes sp.]